MGGDFHIWQFDTFKPTGNITANMAMFCYFKTALACPAKAPLPSGKEVCLVNEEMKYAVEQDETTSVNNKLISANFNFQVFSYTICQVISINISGYMVHVLC